MLSGKPPDRVGHRTGFARRLLPLILVVACVWLLIGCIYLPTAEKVRLTGSKKDFRPLVGTQGSASPIVPGRISRAAVEALLGDPPFASENDRRVMYVIHTSKGMWILPLCFRTTNNNVSAIGLVLDFDQTGMLQDWHQLEAGPPLGNYMLSHTDEEQERSSEWELVDRTNRPGTDTQPTTTASVPGPWELRPVPASK